MLLCDAADQVGGKLYIMGGGWTHLLYADQPTSMALAIVLGVSWNETNERHLVEAALRTDDGEQVLVQGQPVVQSGQIEVGRPAGLKPGSTLNTPLAMSFHGLALPAGGYVWDLHVNRELMARAAFRVGPFPA